MDEHLKRYGRRGPEMKDRPNKLTKEERRDRCLARARKHYAKNNAKRRVKKFAALRKRVEELCSQPFPSGLSDKLK